MHDAPTHHKALIHETKQDGGKQMYTDFSAQLVLDVVLEESDAVLPYVPPTKPEVASFQELHSHALGTTKEPLSQQIDRFHRMQGHHLEMESCDSDMDALPSFTGILNPPEAGPGCHLETATHSKVSFVLPTARRKAPDTQVKRPKNCLPLFLQSVELEDEEPVISYVPVQKQLGIHAVIEEREDPTHVSDLGPSPDVFGGDVVPGAWTSSAEYRTVANGSNDDAMHHIHFTTASTRMSSVQSVCKDPSLSDDDMLPPDSEVFRPFPMANTSDVDESDDVLPADSDIFQPIATASACESEASSCTDDDVLPADSELFQPQQSSASSQPVISLELCDEDGYNQKRRVHTPFCKQGSDESDDIVPEDSYLFQPQG